VTADGADQHVTADGADQHVTADGVDNVASDVVERGMKVFRDWLTQRAEMERRQIADKVFSFDLAFQKQLKTKLSLL
jgi:hypothetical protein